MPRRPPVRSLIASLIVEAFQAEESAASHCGREADRLGSAAPALSMRSVSDHARQAMSTLAPLSRTRTDGETELAATGKGLGRMLAGVREVSADMMLSSEKAYRSTLLGIHHSMITILLLEDAAVEAEDQDLADFCAEWLAERTRRIADCERDLAWFAQNPERALRRALPPFVKRLQRAVPLPEVLRERTDHVA